MADGLTPRARRIVTAARGVLESEGADAVTMRRVADELGVRAASLYKHLPDKAALEAAITIEHLANHASAFVSCLIAVAPENGHMQKNIRHAVIWDNEAIALRGIKPLDLTCDDGDVDAGLFGRLTERRNNWR